MPNFFESPFRGKLLSEQVTNPNIVVGRYSYYSGYYHGHSFDDCALFLMPDRDDIDRLFIGSFCSIGTGAAFVMAGNQGCNGSAPGPRAGRPRSAHGPPERLCDPPGPSRLLGGVTSPHHARIE